MTGRAAVDVELQGVEMPQPSLRMRRALEDIDSQIRNAVDSWPLDPDALTRIANLEIARSAILRLINEAESELRRA